MEWALVAAFLGTGILVGSLAGFFGIGGGLVAIPIYLSLFPLLGVDGEHIVHLAFGTNLFTVIFSSSLSCWTHAKKGNVYWRGAMVIGMFSIIGGIVGAKIAYLLPGDCLKSIFTILLFYSALRIFPKRRTPSSAKKDPEIRAVSTAWFVIAGILTGMISGITGLGGAIISIPLMISLLHFPVKYIAGTSSTIMIFTSVAASSGYIWAGWNTEGLPPGSLGYIYIPAGILVLLTAPLFSHLGARLNHKISAERLQWIFAIFLVVMGVKMLFF